MGSAWRDKAGSLFTTEKQEAVASRGMVAANHPLAAAAGLEMLALGGNAIDAAVATVFALTVVEPMMVSIFGAGFVNFYDASTGNSVIVDNYTVAPAAATPDMYIPVSDTWPLYLETVGQQKPCRLFGSRCSRCAQELVLSRSRLWAPRPGDRPATCHALCGARLSRQSISGRYYPPLSAGPGTLPGQPSPLPARWERTASGTDTGMR